MGKSTKKPHRNYQPFYRKSPPRMLPQLRAAFKKFKQHKWKCPLPDEYKKLAKVINAVLINGDDLASLINPQKNKHHKRTYEIALAAINNIDAIDYLLKKFNILENNKFLDEWIAKVLIADMLWGSQFLRSNSNPVEALKYYEEDLRESFVEVMTLFPNPVNDSVATSLPVYIRINRLLISIEESIQAFIDEGWKLVAGTKTYFEHLKVLAGLRGNYFMKDYHISELLIFPPCSSFYSHPGYLNGRFLLQDKGSCLSSFLLNPKPESTVLDIFAATGIKTNHIANIMENTGIIYANDIHPERSISMRNVMELTNVKCVKQIQDDYVNIQDHNATHILVDHTSSQSGIFMNRPKTGQALKIRRLKFSLSMALRLCLQSFPNTKRVVYTVCSTFSDECEDVVDDALQEVGDSYTLLNLKDKLWNEWTNTGSKEHACGDRCIRTIPEVDLCQGHFIAAFERNFDVPVPPYAKRSNKKKNHTEEEEPLESD